MKKIVYNFHCYEPLIFTHQGAYWVDRMPPKFRIGYPRSLSEYREARRFLNPDMASDPAFSLLRGKLHLKPLIRIRCASSRRIGRNLQFSSHGDIFSTVSVCSHGLSPNGSRLTDWRPIYPSSEMVKAPAKSLFKTI